MGKFIKKVLWEIVTFPVLVLGFICGLIGIAEPIVRFWRKRTKNKETKAALDSYYDRTRVLRAKPADDQMVESFTIPGLYYEVDINLETCTCPDWLNRRARYGLGDPRRICKHLASVYPITAITDDRIVEAGIEGRGCNFRGKDYDPL